MKILKNKNRYEKHQPYGHQINASRGHSYDTTTIVLMKTLTEGLCSKIWVRFPDQLQMLHEPDTESVNFRSRSTVHMNCSRLQRPFLTRNHNQLNDLLHRIGRSIHHRQTDCTCYRCRARCSEAMFHALCSDLFVALATRIFSRLGHL